MPFVLNSGSASGLLNLNVVSSNPVPSYPFPTTGLMGWYDSSPTNTSSILLNDDSGNPVSSGTNGAYVNTWQNLYTSGTAVMPDLQQPYGGSQPTYSTSQNYGLNQASGTNYPGIVFPASSGATLDVGFNGDTFPDSVTGFTIFIANPGNTLQPPYQDTIFDLRTAYRPNTRANKIWTDGRITGQCGSADVGTIGYGPYPSGSPLNGRDKAIAGYFNTDENDNLYIATMAKLNGVFTEVCRSGTSTFQSFANSNDTAPVTSVSDLSNTPVAPLPWTGFHLSSGNGPIGEFLIYNGAPSADDCKSIMNYLMTKWA